MDMKKEVFIFCRICFKPCEENSKPIEEISKVLSILSLQLDLTVNDNHEVCGNCEEKLQEASEFKLRCLRIEDDIQKFVGDNMKSNLKQIYVNSCENENVQIPEDHIVCRLCVKLTIPGYCVQLSDETKDAVSAQITLEKYIPEIDLSATEDPVVCASCLVSLQSYFSLMTSCSSVEEQITDDKSQVNVNDAVQFIPISTFGYKNEGHSEHALNLVKEEAQDLNFKYEDVNIKTESDFVRLADNMLASCPELNTEFSETQISKTVLCTYASKLKSDVKKQMMVHKNPSKMTNYHCEVCEFRTVYKNSLNRHMLIHKNASEVTMYQCKVCLYESRHKDVLKRHMLVHQNSANVKLLHCDLCAYSTTSIMYLKRHVLVHNEKIFYKCELCPYKARVKRYLNCHMLIHKDASEVRKYQCDMCDYETKHKSCLQQHVVMHHKSVFEVALYQCEVCTFVTKLKSVLKRHMVTHDDPSKLTMYECEVCGFKAKFKYVLTRHMLTH